MARGANVTCLMSNLFHLLQENGRIELEIQAPQPLLNAPQNPDASAHGLDVLRPFTVCFWEMGWFHHRFEIEDVRPIEPSATSHSSGAVLVRMKKVATTLREKTAARVMMADFSVVPHDMDGSLTI
jgi:hypothetical protein